MHQGVKEEEGGVERVCERVVTQVEGGQTVPRLYYHPGGREGRGGKGRGGREGREGEEGEGREGREGRGERGGKGGRGGERGEGGEEREGREGREGRGERGKEGGEGKGDVQEHIVGTENWTTGSIPARYKPTFCLETLSLQLSSNSPLGPWFPW